MAWSARPEGTAEFFNQHFLDYMGLSAEQAEGWGWTAAVHTDDMGELAATWQAIMASERWGETEARLRRYDGEYRWFLFRANPLRDEAGKIVKWYGVNTDIDARKRAEAALLESERKARLIVDSIPGMIAVFSANGELEFVNQQHHDYFNRPIGEQKRWEARALAHPDDVGHAAEVFKNAIASGDPFEIETRARRSDDVYRWIQSRGRPLRDANGAITNWYNLLVDIDDRKRAEDALRESEHQARLIVDSIPGLVATLSPIGEVEIHQPPNAGVYRRNAR